jgi:exopolysaccharide biosynthesis protein
MVNQLMKYSLKRLTLNWKNKKMKIFAAIFAVILVVIVYSADSPQLRWSMTSEKARIVLDAPGGETAQFEVKNGGKQLIVHVPLSKALLYLITPIPPLTLDGLPPAAGEDGAEKYLPLPFNFFKDDVLSNAMVTVDGINMNLELNLLKARKFVFLTMPADNNKPFRAVIDVYKNFKNISETTLTPAIKYTRYEIQDDTSYIFAHFVTVDLNDKRVALKVVPAVGKENVVDMTTRVGGVCGVNAGYFMGDAKPVGLLKSAGQILSMPLWKRTAMGLTANGGVKFGNPTGGYTVIFPDDVEMEALEHLDATILPIPPTAEVYPGKIYSTAPAGNNTISVIVKNNIITTLPITPIPLLNDEYCVLLRGGMAEMYRGKLNVGATLKIFEKIAADWRDINDAVGAGPRLLNAGNVAITAEIEKFKPDIAKGSPSRTAIGITAGNKLIMVSVEAPKVYGGGATLDQLATFLKSRGAVDAMNFDGGASTTMAIGNSAVNLEDKAWRRPVASSLVITDERMLGKIAATNTVKDK